MEVKKKGKRLSLFYEIRQHYKTALLELRQALRDLLMAFIVWDMGALWIMFGLKMWADTFARFARCCGNCENQYERHMIISNLTAYNGTAGQFIAGINFNYNDSATITDLKLGGASAHKVNACKKFVGVTSGEPKSNGTDADGKYCIYDPASITYLS
uniref:Probable pectate lyase F n=1 Tax=Ditylenchus dipsaci TaxID=166011 RepID=A0A915EHH1_9BILA